MANRPKPPPIPRRSRPTAAQEAFSHRARLRIPETDQLLLGARYANGTSLRAMSREFGVHPSVIRGFVVRHGYPIRTRIQGVQLSKSKVRDDASLRRIAYLYTVKELTLREIALKMSVHHSTVSKALCVQGITIRRRGITAKRLKAPAR